MMALALIACCAFAIHVAAGMRVNDGYGWSTYLSSDAASAYKSVANAEGVAITFGMPVYAFGNSSVKKSVQAGPYAAARVIGIVADATIASLATGRIVVARGVTIPAVPINGVLAAGSDVWLDSTAGTLTTAQLDPTAAGSVGKFLVRIGTIVNYSAGAVADLLFDPGIPEGL